MAKTKSELKPKDHNGWLEPTTLIVDGQRAFRAKCICGWTSTLPATYRDADRDRLSHRYVMLHYEELYGRKLR